MGKALLILSGGIDITSQDVVKFLEGVGYKQISVDKAESTLSHLSDTQILESFRAGKNVKKVDEPAKQEESEEQKQEIEDECE